MKPILHLYCKRDGPGERQQLFDQASSAIERFGATSRVRIDVPQRGSEGDSDGPMRSELEIAIPAIQSGSLFGDRQAVEFVNAQWIQSHEGVILSDLLSVMDPEACFVVMIAFGALPRSLKLGELVNKVEVAPLSEKGALSWLGEELRSRGMKIDNPAAEALISRFGTDVASIGQALDQLAMAGEPITRELVLDRFKNRPEVATFGYGDAVEAGDVGLALKHLEDFLVHGHPLQLVGQLDAQLRARSLAAVATDFETYKKQVRMPEWKAKKLYASRASFSEENLRLSVAALVRADHLLKTAPEDTYRLTMERLTVALCRWAR